MSIYPDQSIIDSRYKEHLNRLRGLVMLPAEGLLLDLSAIPQEPPGLKDVLFKWILKANSARLIKGEPLIITKALVLSCPIWKFTAPPLRSVPLTPEALLQPFKPTPTIGRKPPGSINRKKK